MSTPTCNLLGPRTGKPCTRTAGHSTDGEFHEARDLEATGGACAPLLESWRTEAEEARQTVDPTAAEIAASHERLPLRREVKEPLPPEEGGEYPATNPDRRFVDVLFDGPPAPVSGRFIEVEDESGRSINAGAWIDRDGYWALRIDTRSPGLDAASRVIACISSTDAHSDAFNRHADLSRRTSVGAAQERASAQADRDRDAFYRPGEWQSGYRQAIADALAAIEAARKGDPLAVIVEGREVAP